MSALVILFTFSKKLFWNMTFFLYLSCSFLTGMHGLMQRAGDLPSNAFQVASFLIRSSKTWKINHKQPCTHFNRKKMTADVIKPVTKQQWEKAIATQCGAKT